MFEIAADKRVDVIRGQVAVTSECRKYRDVARGQRRPLARGSRGIAGPPGVSLRCRFHRVKEWAGAFPSSTFGMRRQRTACDRAGRRVAIKKLNLPPLF